MPGRASVVDEDAVEEALQANLIALRFNPASVELIDRFGLLPPPAQNLLEVAHQRQKATHLGIKRIEVSAQGGYIDFAEQTRVNPAFLVGLLQSQPRIFRMEGPTRLRFQIPCNDNAARLKLVDDLLTQLTANQL